MSSFSQDKLSILIEYISFILYIIILLQSNISCISSQSQSQHLSNLELKDFNIRNNYPLPIYSYGGVSGIWNNYLYFHSGYNCLSSSIVSCSSNRSSIDYSLDIDSVDFDSNIDLILRHVPSWHNWTDINFNNTGPNHDDVITPTSHTQVGNYSFIVINNYNYSPSLLKYDLRIQQYIDKSTFLSSIPVTLTQLQSKLTQKISDYQKYVPCVTSIDDENLYIMGITGFHRYNALYDIWDTFANINIARYQHSCLIINKIPYILGGIDVYTGSILSSIEVYNISSNKWQILNDLIIPRYQHISVQHPYNPWIITIGGIANNNMIEIYDINNDIVATTNVIYDRTQFYHSSYNYGIRHSVDATAIYLYGGKSVDSIQVYGDIHYLVLIPTILILVIQFRFDS